MLKFKLKAGALFIFAFTFMLVSCSSDDEIISSVDNLSVAAKTGSTSNTTSPWDTDSSYNSGDDFQVDNDGNGAHNWNESEWDSNPDPEDRDNGFNIRKYCYGDGGTAVLTCPNGSSTRRAEYRDATNIDLDKNNKQDFTFSIVDYDNEHELIMAQMHNDGSNVERPYLTVSAEDGEIKLKRSDNYTKGSGTTTASSTLTYRTNDRYRIKMDSASGSRSVYIKIWNLDTGESASTTFTFDNSWNSKDGSFYWKHGVYMPDGGSDDTAMRVESVSFATNK